MSRGSLNWFMLYTRSVDVHLTTGVCVHDN